MFFPRIKADMTADRFFQSLAETTVAACEYRFQTGYLGIVLVVADLSVADL